jgi:transmembrane protein EpsG
LIIYYVLFTVLAFFSIYEKNNKFSEISLKILFLILILFVGLRYQVGNDYEEYFLHHSLIKQGTTNYFEPLFTLMNYITPTPYLMFFISATISFVFLYQAFKYFAPNQGILLTTLYFGIYLVIFNIHIIRQGIAVALILYSWKFAVENKKLIFITLVFIAMGFHSSAIVALPIYFLTKINFDKIFKVMLLSISTIILFIFIFFKEEIFNIISLIPLFERYAKVYLDPEFSGSEPISFGFILNITAFFIVEFLLVKRPVEFNNKKIQLIEKIFFISVIGSILLRFSSIALRFNYYYQISNIIIFAIIIFSFKEKVIFKIIFILIALLYLYVNLNTGHAIVEYKTILSKL